VTLLASLANEIRRVFRKRLALFGAEPFGTPNHPGSNRAVRTLSKVFSGRHYPFEYVGYIGRYRYVLSGCGDFDPPFERGAYVHGEAWPGTN
jgi:hypothetical protein